MGLIPGAVFLAGCCGDYLRPQTSFFSRPARRQVWRKCSLDSDGAEKLRRETHVDVTHGLPQTMGQGHRLDWLGTDSWAISSGPRPETGPTQIRCETL